MGTPRHSRPSRDSITVGIVNESSEYIAEVHRAGDPPVDYTDESVEQKIASILNEIESVEVVHIRPVDLQMAVLNKRVLAVDGVINIATGEPGRFQFSRVPLLLEKLKLPYSGGNPFQLMLCRDKYRLKMIAQHLGLLSPPCLMVTPESVHLARDLNSAILPAIVKPNEAGAGLGMSEAPLETQSAAGDYAATLLRDHPEGVLIEKFVGGEEVTVAVLGGNGTWKAYSFVLRDQEGQILSPLHLNTPANLRALLIEGKFRWLALEDCYGSKLAKRTETATLKLVSEIGVSGYVRADFRYDARTNDLWFLELNGQAGISLGNSVIAEIGLALTGEADGFIREFVRSFVADLAKRIDGQIVGTH